ncbi:hypothetical protein [Mesorhizobium huakuii]|uniref:hypothetical protein n=1 Tax=Mesorhizobium huakuii TaxID=28104 RepID=UPI0024E12AE6|nr:hypothetical protein [Mesorhizobium huakuii]
MLQQLHHRSIQHGIAGRRIPCSRCSIHHLSSNSACEYVYSSQNETQAEIWMLLIYLMLTLTTKLGITWFQRLSSIHSPASSERPFSAALRKSKSQRADDLSKSPEVDIKDGA